MRKNNAKLVFGMLFAAAFAKYLSYFWTRNKEDHFEEEIKTTFSKEDLN